MRSSLNDRVQHVIDDLVASGVELGLQVAAYVNGQRVVDCWAGVANEASGRLVDGDTLFTSWSTTKGFVATCVHILAERGRIAYDTPIAHYWPEFAAAGKEAVTVRQALSHTAGVPQMPLGVTPEIMADWDAMVAAIAGHELLWEPGTKFGYHALTFGWILGELVRRVDGRPIAQFAREELCAPLGIDDFFLGIEDHEQPRVAPLQSALPPPPEDMPAIAHRIAPPEVVTAEVFNRPDVRRAVIPGAGGIMTARAVARHYAMLAGGGMLDGVRLLSPERVEEIRAPQTEHLLDLFGAKDVMGLGYKLGGSAADGRAPAMGEPGTFGHAGHGGSLGFADPARGLAFGLTKNRLRAWDDPTQSTAYRVAEAIRHWIDNGQPVQ
jgi:CubicO group peptidase (beta-lactamase class C family)